MFLPSMSCRRTSRFALAFSWSSWSEEPRDSTDRVVPALFPSAPLVKLEKTTFFQNKILLVGHLHKFPHKIWGLAMALYMRLYTYIGWNPSLPLLGPLQRLCWQELLRGCVNHEGVPNFWRLFSQLPGTLRRCSPPPPRGLSLARGRLPGPAQAGAWFRRRMKEGKADVLPKETKKGVNTRDILYHDCTCLQKMFHVTWLQKLPLRGLLFLWFSYDQKQQIANRESKLMSTPEALCIQQKPVKGCFSPAFFTVIY